MADRDGNRIAGQRGRIASGGEEGVQVQRQKLAVSRVGRSDRGKGVQRWKEAGREGSAADGRMQQREGVRRGRGVGSIGVKDCIQGKGSSA